MRLVFPVVNTYGAYQTNNCSRLLKLNQESNKGIQQPVSVYPWTLLNQSRTYFVVRWQNR